MTRSRDYVGVDWAVKQRVNIKPPHKQLKDLLWPGTSPNSVIIASEYRVEEISYSRSRAPSTRVSTLTLIRSLTGFELSADSAAFCVTASPCGSFPAGIKAVCSFDFEPCCISVGNGVVAAGGRNSEIAIRPLPSSAGSSSHTGGASGSNSRGGIYGSPHSAWTLKPSPHGSIVNAISIVPSSSSSSSSSVFEPYSSAGAGPSRSRNADSYRRRRQSNYGIMDDHEGPILPGVGNFDNDAPHQSSLELATAAAVQDLLDEEEEDELAREEMGAAYGYHAGGSWQRDTDPLLPRQYQRRASSYGTQYRDSRNPSWLNSTNSAHFDPYDDEQYWSARKSIREGTAHGSAWLASSLNGETEPSMMNFKLNVSTNEKTVRSYRVRTPRASALSYERSPGLILHRTAYFSTPINHTSTSPDRRTLVAVGDSNDVFLRRLSPTGELTDLTTLQGSGGGSFSTSWHPSGLQFAVGSSDGRVHVWDIRSSKPLALLETVQDSQQPHVMYAIDEDINAIRTVKYSPCGRMLAYAQHMDAFHVVETVSYADSQRVAAPQLLDRSPRRDGASRSMGADGAAASGSGTGPSPAGPASMPSTGPFVGPGYDDEHDDHDDDDGYEEEQDAPEAPPPHMPRILDDRAAIPRLSTSEHRSRFLSRAGQSLRGTSAAAVAFVWEDLNMYPYAGAGAAGAAAAAGGPDRSGSGGGGGGGHGLSGSAREFGYRSALRFSPSTGLGGGAGSHGMWYGPSSSSFRRAAAPWLHSGSSNSTSAGGGAGGTSSSTSTSAQSSSTSASHSHLTGPSSLASLSDVDFGRLARRSRVQATADEQRAARQAFTYRRRTQLDGSWDWTSGNAPLSPPTFYTTGHRDSGPLDGAPGPSSPTFGGSSSYATTARTTLPYESDRGPGRSTIWVEPQPDLPPSPVLPSRQYQGGAAPQTTHHGYPRYLHHQTQAQAHPSILRSRSPFTGTEMSPEYLEELDVQSWSAIYNLRRRQSLASSHVELAGLCWEPDGSALYVASKNVVARYPVLDMRLSSSHAGLV